ncbi:HRDC domain-containing protein [Xylanimonas protaetiae]|uniref:Ribonuclease D n=1 Tax=Xylanimonas protaetiae TaxID=2509457 RepID=A0A4P6F5I4_9MICO|nr:ribonuclease D [Xylanimonas protaetiae]QAY71220.1 ribonuclease D [Xylanimonas protaetiae]
MTLPPETPEVVPLREPAGGVPEVVDTPAGLAKVVAALAGGTGPVAADCERASGYRYGQSTFLVQLRREGAGTALLDPVPLPDLSAVGAALGDVEWVLHAASQDLPGLHEHGLFPAKVFDTELAARLLGLERVGLAAVVADTLGLGLAKEHSAVDWSTRPLPVDWLRYAALDVEVLVDVRDVLADRLADAGKDAWAAQEFEAVRLAPPPAPRVDPWRRVSGTHLLRDRRKLAVVRALWEARDASARARDIAPGRVLPDRAIVAAAQALPRTAGQLVTIGEFAGKGQRRRAAYWQRAVDQAMALPETALPSLRGPSSDGPPQPRLWADRDPQAAHRLGAAREVVAALSEQHHVPVENVLQPDALRRLCWAPPASVTADSVSEFLRGRGARAWQLDLTAGPLAAALTSSPS